MTQLVDMQRDAMNEELASAGKIKPPEMRVGKILGDGIVHLDFTNKMLFSEDLREKINAGASF